MKHNSKFALWLTLGVTATIFLCGPAIAKQTIDSKVDFEVTGQVVSKSDSGFKVQTDGSEFVEIVANDSTDFALRLSSPWFDANLRKVVVDGKDIGNGKRERISYSLPEGKLYLLAQFRTAKQRQRVLGQPLWRINNYLISDQPIEALLPTGDELLLAGELDLKNQSLIIEDKSWPIRLGFRGATLRGRSLTDIVPGETVVLVTGKRTATQSVAETVIFMIR